MRVWSRHAFERSIGPSHDWEAEMPYRTMGWIHATVSRLLHDQAARDRELGQGTVEYVGLMLLLATLLTGVVVAAGKLKDAGLAKTIAAKLKETIDAVGNK